MRATTPVRLILTVLLVLGTTGLASEASAQLMLGGMQVEGEVEAGLQFFPEDPSRKESQKFEEYRDMGEGLNLENLRLRFFRPDDSYAFEFAGSKWGREDQEFSLRAGRLGLWEFGFEWDQTPHTLSTTARSLAVETSPGVFTLPAVRPPLTAHNSAPEIDDITVRWDTAKLNFKLTPTPELELGVNYTRIDKNGERPKSLAFSTPGGTFYEIAAPVDEQIHDLRLRAVYARERWQFQGTYALSVFENGLRRLLVDNPCFGNPAGCGDAAAQQAGQLSVAPSNMAHTVSLGGGVNLPMRTRVTGNFSYSLRLQNDSFLPHSIRFSPASNPDLALPAESLDGQVHVLLGHVSLVTRPLRPLTVTAKYRIYDFNDQTDVLTFVRTVTNDRTIAGTTRSEQLSFQRQNFDLDNRIQIIRPLALTVGSGWERWDRGPHREVRESDEFFGKLALDATPADWLQARLKYAPSFRRINEYVSLGGVSPLARKYDEAERDRHKVDLSLQLVPSEVLTVTPTFGWRDDQYDFGYHPVGVEQLGLLDEQAWSAGADLSWMPIERLTVSLGYMYENMRQTMRSRRSPNSNYFDYDWISEQNDRNHTAYVRLTARLVPKVLDLEIGGNYASAYSPVEQFNPTTPTSSTAANDSNATATPLPAYQSVMLRLDAALKYHFLKQWTATLRYAFESYEQRDWRTDILQPYMDVSGSDPIWLGSHTENYTAHIVGLSLGYRFGK